MMHDELEDSITFKSRFLMFMDTSVVGIFPGKNDFSQSTYIIISSNAEFSYINNGLDNRTHLTRYVPSEYYDMIKKLLDFRNHLVISPYLCKRFNGGEEYNGCNKLTLCKCKTLENSYQLEDSLGENYVSIEPFGNIVKAKLRTVYREEDVSCRMSQYAKKYSILQTFIFPIKRIPKSLERAIEVLTHNNSTSNSDGYESQSDEINYDISEVTLASAKYSKEALSLFESISPELTLLKDLNSFPRSFLTIAECIDAKDVYILSSSNRSSGDTFDPSRDQMSVDYWKIDHLYHHNDLDLDLDLKESLEDDWDISVCISLSKDIFQVKCKHGDQVKESVSHMSLLDLKTNQLTAAAAAAAAAASQYASVEVGGTSTSQQQEKEENGNKGSSSGSNNEKKEEDEEDSTFQLFNYYSQACHLTCFHSHIVQYNSVLILIFAFLFLFV